MLLGRRIFREIKKNIYRQTGAKASCEQIYSSFSSSTKNSLIELEEASSIQDSDYMDQKLMKESLNLK